MQKFSDSFFGIVRRHTSAISIVRQRRRIPPWISVASTLLLETTSKASPPRIFKLSTFFFLYTSFPQLWEVFKTQRLTFRLLLLMALLGNSLQGFSISSAGEARRKLAAPPPLASPAEGSRLLPPTLACLHQLAPRHYERPVGAC